MAAQPFAGAPRTFQTLRLRFRQLALQRLAEVGQGGFIELQQQVDPASLVIQAGPEITLGIHAPHGHALGAAEQHEGLAVLAGIRLDTGYQAFRTR